ncbi:unnamed protein product [Ilex paraguariensis]|uniref:Uncharacterized protein n=1 Tax=Ilex paraguariensis TaxID=185542 RepID=A0ABC8SFB5_9AQUA
MAIRSISLDPKGLEILKALIQVLINATIEEAGATIDDLDEVERGDAHFSKQVELGLEVSKVHVTNRGSSEKNSGYIVVTATPSSENICVREHR